MHRLISDIAYATIFFRSLNGVFIAFGHTIETLVFGKNLLKSDISIAIHSKILKNCDFFTIWRKNEKIEIYKDF